MARRRLVWQLYFSYLAITLATLLAVGWYAGRSLRRVHVRETRSDLEDRARLIRDEVRRLVAQGSTDRIDALCKTKGRTSATRLTVILPDGVVVGDSDEDPAAMVNHADRPEIRAAYAGQVGAATRYSYTLGQEMTYVAVPLLEDGRLVGVLRTSLPMDALRQTLRASYLSILVGALVVAGLAAVLCWWVSQRISRPLEIMKRCAARFAKGELTSRVPVAGSKDVALLADALNDMAEQLDDRIRTIALERNEKDAIFRSMVEGVIAVDAEEHLLSINDTARRMLGIEAARDGGAHFMEVVRHPDLQDLLSEVLAGRGPLEGEAVIREEGDRVLHAVATQLRSSGGEEIGALLILNDVTRLRRLERVRQDFVANVSHELRTPITSIKGFVETLLEDPADNPEHVRRFLHIVLRQADRLSAIIDDLLLLSSMEQDAEGRQLTRVDAPVRDVVASAVELCAARAEEKNIDIRLDCPADLEAPINAPLLEQALVNLIDNAVKYSDANTRVTVTGARETDGVALTVRDVGCGISEEHLPRLFERFYRVDTARSRKLGGTGLGLAIVKHIARAHGGRVSVTSTLGQGSAFVLHLPSVAPVHV
jgi:two-component system phosphate regulon sensor histidine kinase PhoR